MKLSLSTNWCNRRIGDGRAIAEKAFELGFGELELGFHTTLEQVAGFKAMLDKIPVGSVHAFAPVPLSAPCGSPELYALATFDAEARKMAALQVVRNVRFAAEMGADTVVLHAGRVPCKSWLGRDPMKKRRANGAKLLEAFKPVLAEIVPELEKNRVTLALENLPYLEGFPAEWEIGDVVGEWVKAWFDTGHNRVRECRGWIAPESRTLGKSAANFAGMHLNDVEDKYDDHFAPGKGKVDFAALKYFARSVRHVVFEPAHTVSEEDLISGIQHIKSIWEA